MKKIILSALAAILTLSASAQKTEVQMATLQHNDQTFVFYGENALVNAYHAAADTLDVITLSSGTFKVPNPISKSISIYGAGCQDNTDSGTKATILDGILNFTPADMINDYGETVIGGKHVNGIHLEGLSMSAIYLVNKNNTPIHNLTIKKCHVTSGVNFQINSYNTNIRQCHMDYISGTYNNFAAENMVIENCHLRICADFPYSSTIHINHCIIKDNSNSQSGPYYYTNNIIYRELSSSATAYNNIFVCNGIGSNVFGENNWIGIANEGIYAADGEDGTWGENKDYMIKFPLKYVGNDGTVVGLHGGNYPWNKVPCIPRITSSEIDTKTSTDGKLKVSIQAEVPTVE